MNNIFIKEIILDNFRNYNYLKQKFSNYANIIYGENGTGKTNLIEAISLINKGRGIRSCNLDDLINQNNSHKDEFNIFCKLNNHLEFENIGTNYKKNNKRIFQANNKILTPKQNIINFIYFTPQIDGIFLQSKQTRRQFFDQIINNIDPYHTTRINKYDKLIRERINILESCNNDNWLNVIEQQIAENAIAITSSRIEAINCLNYIIKNLDSSFLKSNIIINGVIEANFKDNTAINIENNYLQNLKKNRDLDKITKKTNFGIHRSNFSAVYQNIDAKNCSTGQQKSILISILLSQIYLYLQLNKSTPILLLDEIISHLDQNNCINLFEQLAKFELQYFITATNKEGFKNFERIYQKEINYINANS